MWIRTGFGTRKRRKQNNNLPKNREAVTFAGAAGPGGNLPRCPPGPAALPFTAVYRFALGLYEEALPMSMYFSTISILFSLIVWIVIIFIAYFVIKIAVKNAVLEA